MRQLIILFCGFVSFTCANAQKINVIPEPASTVYTNNGSFSIQSSTRIFVGKGAEMSAAFLQQYLKKYYGFELKHTTKEEANTIILKYTGPKETRAGAYVLESSKQKLTISSADSAGIFYGVQTLIQLLPVDAKSSIQIPSVQITDYPRFEYRGLHLDVSRHIFPVEYVKKYINYIALHKMNYFHWHLTDDQGWRIESKNILSSHL